MLEILKQTLFIFMGILGGFIIIGGFSRLIIIELKDIKKSLICLLISLIGLFMVAFSVSFLSVIT